MSDGRCRIIAIQLGEAALNFILPGQPHIRVKVALLNEDGSPCGSLTKENGWSEKTYEAMKALADAIEEDAASHVFEGESVPAQGELPGEPPQF